MRWFNETIEEGKREYDEMMATITTATTEIARLTEEATGLTVAAEIKGNKRATKLLEADLKFAKGRSEELKA